MHHRGARPAGDRGRSGFGQDHGDGGPRGVAGRHRAGGPRAGPRSDVHQQGGGRTRRTGPQGARQGGSHRPGRHRPGQPAGRAGHLHVPRLRGQAADRPRPAHRSRTDVPAPRRRHPLPARRARAARGTGPVPGTDPLLPRPGRGPPDPRLRALRTPRDGRGPAYPRRRAAAHPGERATHQRGSAQGPRGRRGPARTRRAGGPLPRGETRARPPRLRRPDRPLGHPRQYPSRGRGDPARRVPGGPAGRVPGHVGGPAHPARRAVRWRHRAPRHGGR